MAVRGVAFFLSSGLPVEARLLLEDFGLVVNEAIRAGLQTRVTSRNALAKPAYRDFRIRHPGMYSQHLVSSFEVAASALKNYRRRLRRAPDPRVPYIKRLMMKAENQAYKLGRECGTIDLPIRAGLHVTLNLVLSEYHRRYMNDKSLSVGSLTILHDRVIIAFRKETPKPFVPDKVLSLDTNERSLDGVLVSHGSVAPVKASFSEVAVVQQRHHDRRKSLQMRKAHDRRKTRFLFRREKMREHDRVQYRLHQVANSVLSFAEEQKSAIVLEDLKGTKFRKSRDLNRRLSMWPRRKVCQIIEYKAEWKGIPVMKVDPRYSSRRCPICGRIQDSRMGIVFECECGWKLDRHINASLNLLQTAISNGLEVAGGLRFDPGAFQHDVMMIPCEPAMAARLEPNGTRCIGAVA